MSYYSGVVRLGPGPGSQCQNIVGEQLCPLDWGHSGACIDWLPGGYLAVPPVLDPLGVLLLRSSRWPWWPCPVCSRRIDGWDSDQQGLYVWDLGPAGIRELTGVLWRFSPCGCEAREVAR